MDEQENRQETDKTDATEINGAIEPIGADVDTQTSETTGVIENVETTENAQVCETAGQTQEAETDEDRKAKKKSKFKRAGLSVAALYGIMSVAQGAFLTVAIIFIISALSVFDFSTGDISVNSILSRIAESGAAIVTALAIVLSTVASEIVGIKVMGKIMGKVAAPIEKKSLSHRQIVIAVLGSFGLWGIGAAVGNILEVCGCFFEYSSEIEALFGNYIIIYFILAIFGAPILEELIFRKVLIDRLHVFGKVPAALASALLFGLLHGNSGQFFLAFNIGLIFAAIYQYTGNVKYTMLLHFMINFFASIPNLLMMIPSLQASEEIIAFAWSALAAILMLAGIVALIAFRKDELLDFSDNTEHRSVVFSNVGMKLCIIGGLILLGIQDASTVISKIQTGKSILPLVGLISTAIAIAGTIIMVKKYGNSEKPKEEIVEEKEPW